MSIFTQVAMRKVKSSLIDLSHDVKFSFNMGELIPTCIIDVLPGDKFELGQSNLIRMAPMLAPLMHKVNVTMHYWFVPNRLLWPNWETFITGDTDNVPPFLLDNHLIQQGNLGDYLGVPVDVGTGNMQCSAFPLAAYYKIWDDCYRDQNLQTEVGIELTDGRNNGLEALMRQDPRKRAWMHDYFTSALPWAQKGDAVSLPLTNSQDVDVDIRPGNTNPAKLRKASDQTDAAAGANLQTSNPGSFLNDGTDNLQLDPQGSLKVDINAEAVDINTLREAFSLQRWLERNARGGTRYIESMLAHFGVRSSDKRLQRPELIGGHFSPMTISEVLSTAETLNTSNQVTNPVGEFSGHGISVGRGNKYTYRAEEHGWIMGIINVQPKTAYQQGLPRMYDRRDRLDYFWPDFQDLGEQAILNQEIWAGNLADSTNRETFGYIPRYAEYKYMPDRVAGEMRTNLDFWTLARKFSSLPALNEAFIQCEPSRRIFATTDPNVDTLYAHVKNDVKAIRKMKKHAKPMW